MFRGFVNWAFVFRVWLVSLKLILYSFMGKLRKAVLFSRLGWENLMLHDVLMGTVSATLNPKP